MGARHITRAEKRVIQDLLNQGKSFKEIAVEIKRCPAFVAKHSKPKKYARVKKAELAVQEENQVTESINWKAKYLALAAKLAEKGLI
jgi:IS30 family transposase